MWRARGSFGSGKYYVKETYVPNCVAEKGDPKPYLPVSEKSYTCEDVAGCADKQRYECHVEGERGRV